MPFRIALSGLNAASADLRVIGNNVANASTTGYKKSRAEFADIFASSSLGTAANAIGAGVRISSVSQQFTQGNVGFTDNNLDLAVSGSGFFVLNDNGVQVYTRAGSMSVDNAGFVVNNQGQQLTAFLADSSGNISNGNSGPLQLDTTDIAPQPTSAVTMGLNLDASDAVPVPPVPTSVVTLAGAGQALDTTVSPVTTNLGNILDSYGSTPSASEIVWTDAGGGVWNAQFRVGGADQGAAVPVTIGTTATVSFAWDPDGGGAQPSQTITMDTTSLTEVSGTGTTLTGSNNGSLQAPFSSSDASTFNSSTALTVYDSQGTAHLATYYFRKTGTPNNWEMYSFVNSTQVDGPDTVTFATNGTISAINGNGAPFTQTIPGFVPTGTTAPSTMNIVNTLTGLTQYGSAFSVNTLSQDGFATGRLRGVDIADTGVVTARFTNGQSRTLGQVALASFPNTQGLRQLGDTSWGETFESGSAVISQPGTGSLGLIESGALEGSNVDLTEQLVGMITAQRNFQANAQVITTADTVTQTIINIR
ncbi:Flagellar hook protein FlgE [hydrothermal vent metagenome]|uniref:Flagellar hook protein FlgE n=1 Tax=hydrothermal vent metagenome TaxID=652676 RepID=A0A3B0ZD50_9ZZZZ